MKNLDNKLDVDNWIHLLGKLVFGNKKFFVNCGNLETKLLSENLEEIKIDRPIYITGLARSGSTLLLEILCKHRKFAHHR